MNDEVPGVGVGASGVGTSSPGQRIRCRALLPTRENTSHLAARCSVVLSPALQLHQAAAELLVPRFILLVDMLPLNSGPLYSDFHQILLPKFCGASQLDWCSVLRCL